MEPERTQNFHDRLNQWVASQGFWFQLRYSMSSKGVRGSGLYHFMRLTARAAVFLLVFAAIGLVYMIKRTDTEGFRDKLEASILRETGAKDGKIEGFQQVQGKLSIARFSATGNPDAFFTDLDMQDIGCRMSTFDGVFGPRKPGVISASRMDVHLRAGTRDGDEASRLGDVLFRDRANVEITALDVEDATVGWGYSAFNRGLIRGSHLKARKRENDWWLQFKGGTFSQNWLKGLEIEELEIVCGPDGLHFEKGLLRKGGGTLDLTGLRVSGKERPELAGTLRLKNLSLAGMLPAAVESYLEGFVSGTLKVSGSTNSQEGIGFDGTITLGTGDGLMLRDRIPLLRSLKSVDVFNNYRRVNFQAGSFRMKTGGGRLTVSDVDLEAGDLMTLKGGFLVRPPSKEEKALAGESPKSSSGEAGKDEPGQEIDFTLKRAATETRKKDAKDSGSAARFETRLEERKFAEEMAASIAESLRYEGRLDVTLRPDAFDQASALKSRFPKAGALGRIPIAIPLDGPLGSLTVKEAEEISSLGKKD